MSANTLEDLDALSGELPAVGPQQQAKINMARAIQNPLPEYAQHGLNDSHFGPAGPNGIRPLNKVGMQALNNLSNNNGISDNSNLIAAGQNSAASNLLANIGSQADQIGQAGQGGGHLHNAWMGVKSTVKGLIKPNPSTGPMTSNLNANAAKPQDNSWFTNYKNQVADSSGTLGQRLIAPLENQAMNWVGKQFQSSPAQAQQPVSGNMPNYNMGHISQLAPTQATGMGMTDISGAGAAAATQAAAAHAAQMGGYLQPLIAPLV